MRRHYAALVADCGSGMVLLVLLVDAVRAVFPAFVAGSPPGVSTASCGRQFVHGVLAVGYRTLAVVVISQVHFLDKVTVCFTGAVVQTVPDKVVALPIVCNDSGGLVQTLSLEAVAALLQGR